MCAKITYILKIIYKYTFNLNIYLYKKIILFQTMIYCKKNNENYYFYFNNYNSLMYVYLILHYIFRIKNSNYVSRKILNAQIN